MIAKRLTLPPCVLPSKLSGWLGLQCSYLYRWFLLMVLVVFFTVLLQSFMRWPRWCANKGIKTYLSKLTLQVHGLAFSPGESGRVPCIKHEKKHSLASGDLESIYCNQVDVFLVIIFHRFQFAIQVREVWSGQIHWRSACARPLHEKWYSQGQGDTKLLYDVCELMLLLCFTAFWCFLGFTRSCLCLVCCFSSIVLVACNCCVLLLIFCCLFAFAVCFCGSSPELWYSITIKTENEWTKQRIKKKHTQTENRRDTANREYGKLKDRSRISKKE